MDYPCGKFGDFSFNRFGFITFIVRTNTHTHTHTQTPLNALLRRLSSASNNNLTYYNLTTTYRMHTISLSDLTVAA